MSTRKAPVREIRDRPGHPIRIEFREHNDRIETAPTLCKICGTELGRTSRIAYHILNSDECRDAINAWLEDRMASRRGIELAE